MKTDSHFVIYFFVLYVKKKKIIIFLLNPDLHWISSYSQLLTNPDKLYRIVTNIEENAINHIF